MKTCTYHIKTSDKEMQNSFEKKKKKTRTNFVPTGTNFVPKFHRVKLVENFCLNQMSACVHKNLYVAYYDVQERNAKFFRKKYSYQFCTQMPLGLIGQEF